MIKTICYISNKNIEIQNEGIDSLFKFVIDYNNANHITGLLIHQNNHFFQIIEGEKSVIDNLFKNILIDNRHNGLIKLLDTSIEDRIFDSYNSGHFSVINDYKNLKRIKLYFDWIKDLGILEINELILLTNNFLNYNK